MILPSENQILHQVFESFFSTKIDERNVVNIKLSNAPFFLQLVIDYWKKDEQRKTMDVGYRDLTFVHFAELYKHFTNVHLQDVDWQTLCERDFQIHISLEQAKSAYITYALSALIINFHFYALTFNTELNTSANSIAPLSTQLVDELLSYLSKQLNQQWANFLYTAAKYLFKYKAEDLIANSIGIDEVKKASTEVNPILLAYLLCKMAESMQPDQVRSLLNIGNDKLDKEIPILSNVDLNRVSHFLEQNRLEQNQLHMLWRPLETVALNYRYVCKPFFDKQIVYPRKDMEYYLTDFNQLSVNKNEEQILQQAIFWNAKALQHFGDQNAFVFLATCAHKLHNQQALNVLKEIMPTMEGNYSVKIKELYGSGNSLNKKVHDKINAIFKENVDDLIGNISKVDVLLVKYKKPDTRAIRKVGKFFQESAEHFRNERSQVLQAISHLPDLKSSDLQECEQNAEATAQYFQMINS